MGPSRCPQQLKTLLEKGYRVKGTVRSEEKGKHLKSLFASYADKFEVVVVPDITKVYSASFCEENLVKAGSGRVQGRRSVYFMNDRLCANQLSRKGI
jgi:hypothetical protein